MVDTPNPKVVVKMIVNVMWTSKRGGPPAKCPNEEKEHPIEIRYQDPPTDVKRLR